MLFAIEGMWCGSCARAVEAAVARVPGVTHVGIRFATSSALIRWDPAICDLNAVKACVRGLGYQLASPLPPHTIDAQLEAETRALTVRIAVAIFFGMWSMAAAILLYVDGALVEPADRWWAALASGVLALPALFWAGSPLLIAGWRTARVGAPSLDSIVALGVSGSVLLSVWRLAQGAADVYFDTATTLVTLLLIGRLIEIGARRRTLVAIRALEGVLPERAVKLLNDGSSLNVRADELREGDMILVDAGAVVPADGIVAEGSSALDRSALTGESAPVPVVPGDAATAASVNLSRRLTIQVTAAVGSREIDAIGGHVAAAMTARGETQLLADRLAAVLTVAIPLAALATAAGALVAGLPTSEALLRALSTLVIVCPCALGIATPVAFVAVASHAASRGLLLRDPASWEQLATARTILFDKTGTLTKGRPDVVAVEAVDGWDEKTVLALAAEAEHGIDHPIARAILSAFGNMNALAAASGGERDGRRARTVDAVGRVVVVETASDVRDGGRTRLRVTLDGALIGGIALADAVRPDARPAIRALRKRGLAIRLVTGDASGPAHNIGANVGITAGEIHSGCSPLQKLKVVQSTRGPVVFVGDGINDGPALAAANCGIAVADAHSGATALAAVVVAREGIASIVEAVDLARKTVRIVRQNLAFSIVYNVAALALAALGAVPPIAAAAAMLLSSLSVLANSLRLAPRSRSGQSSLANRTGPLTT